MSKDREDFLRLKRAKFLAARTVLRVEAKRAPVYQALHLCTWSYLLPTLTVTAGGGDWHHFTGVETGMQ